jgi:hypothetical protein
MRGVIFFLMVFGFFFAFAQRVHVSGIVRDQVASERLIGAHIWDEQGQVGAISDNNGYFGIYTEVGHTLTISFIGYSPKEIKVAGDASLAIELTPDFTLNAIVVSDYAIEKIQVQSFNSRHLANVASIGAKPDVVKTLQLLPGIMPQNEGSSRLLVRGGTPGQNLYLIDNAPLIYVNHLGGFTSVFNPDIINSVDIHKSGFPSRFGGKLSSIVDITQKEGDQSGFKGAYSLGVTDASAAIEGPGINKNSSFILTARKTLVDFLYLLTAVPEFGDYVVIYGFHDLNAKYSWKPNLKNSLHFNLYQGDDYLRFWGKESAYGEGEKGKLGTTWGNWLASARWNHIANERLIGINTFWLTRYRLKQTYRTESQTGDLISSRGKFLSSLRDFGIKSDWTWSVLPGWVIDFGTQVSLYGNKPNSIFSEQVFKDETITKASGEGIINSLEGAIYGENEITLFSNTKLNFGARWVHYQSEGYYTSVLEPRGRISIGLHPNHHLTASYSKTHQFSHLLFTQGDIMNNDVWVPANQDIPYASVQQQTIGWSSRLPKTHLHLTIEAYDKKMTNVATYREGFNQLLGDGTWTSKVESGGVGTSRGIEWMIKKDHGELTGFLSYAWSKTEYQFDYINNGRPYVYEYDRPHSVSFQVARKLNDRWSASLNWVYQTGMPYTPAIGRTLVMETLGSQENTYYEELIYGERNSARMRDYHRMDIGFVYKKETKKRQLPAEWTFSIYNLYNRRNPYYYYYNTTGNAEFIHPTYEHKTGNLALYQVSFFPIIPSASYKVYFGK